MSSKKKGFIVSLIVLFFLILGIVTSMAGCFGNTPAEDEGGPGSEEEAKGDWVELDNARYAFFTAADFANGVIDDKKANKELTLKANESYYFVLDFTMQAESNNSGDGKLFASIRVANNSAIVATLEEAASGNVEDSVVNGTKIIKLTYKVPENTEAKNMRVIIKLEPKSEDDSNIEVVFNATGAQVKALPHIDKATAVGYTYGLSYDLVGNTYTVKGMGESTAKELIIPKTKDGKNITAITESAFKNNTSVTSVTIPEYVTSIGSEAFSGCTALTAINYNAATLSVLSNRNNIFGSCGAAGSGIAVTIGKKVTEIPQYLFNSAPKITSVAFESGAICSTINDYAFYGCTSLASVTLPASVKSIGGYAFKDDSAITNLSLAEGLISIGEEAFNGCTSLVNLKLPESLTQLAGSVFYSCKGLKSVTLPANITQAGGNLFAECASLTEIKYNVEADVSYGSYYPLFNNAGASSSGIAVTIGKNVEKIPAYTFMKVSKIMSVTFEAGSVCETIGSQAFYQCTSLNSLSLPEGLTNIGEYAFSGCTSLMTLDLPLTIGNIQEQAFYGCTSLKNLILPDSLTQLGGSAFYGCKGLKSVTLSPNIITPGGNAFAECAALEEIKYNVKANVSYNSNYPLFNNAGASSSGITVTIGKDVPQIPAYTFSKSPKITSVIFEEGSVCTSVGDRAFNAASGLVTIALPEGLATVGKYAFDGCTSLANLTLPQSLNIIDEQAFYGCTSLKNLILPDNLTQLGGSAFYSCKGLKSVTLSPNIVSPSGNAFAECASLEEIKYNVKANVSYNSNYTLFNNAGASSSGITVTIGKDVPQIPAYTFSKATKITSVIFEEGSACAEIGSYAFFKCGMLTSLTLPASVEKINANAFNDCTYLTTINYGGTRAKWTAAIGSVTLPAGCTVRCSDDN